MTDLSTPPALKEALNLLDHHHVGEEKKEQLLMDGDFTANFNSICHDIKLDPQWELKTYTQSPNHLQIPDSSKGYVDSDSRSTSRSSRSTTDSARSVGSKSSSMSQYSSALKGFVSKSASREKRRLEKLRNIKPTYNNNTTASGKKSYYETQSNIEPPQLNWSPPKLDVSLSST